MSRTPPFEDTLWTPGEQYEPDELKAEGNCKGRQRDLSRQLTVLIDVLYALVLVAGAEAYRSLFTRSEEFLHPSLFLPVVLALVLIFFTAIHSFIDYHLAAEDQPYQFLDQNNRGKDLQRFYLDVVIVGLYSFLLLKCHVLLETPGADILPVFVTFPVIFLLFLVWGKLRKRTTSGRAQTYRPALLWVCFALYSVLAIVYVFTSKGWLGNSGFLLGALLIMLFYRWLNWQQNRWCEEAALPAKAPAEKKHAP